MLMRRGEADSNNSALLWRPRWCEIGGKRFYARSNWEANYGCYLQFLKERGLISEWSHEPRTYWFSGIKRGVVSYLPDFEVVEPSGEAVLHEVKGHMDSRSRTKLKRMRKYYPEIRIVLIDRVQYASIKKQLARLIPGWV